MRQGWDDGRKAIVIHMQTAQPAAFQRTAAAFAAEGATIENGSAEAGFLVATPYTVVTLSGNVAIQYRASVVVAGEGADVLLSGTAFEHYTLITGTTNDLTAPLRPSTAEAWAKLQRIADRLRQP
jgi:hypothetical protein